MKKIVYMLIFLLCFSISYSINDRNILVIHSYHHGLDWEDNITEGLESVFDSEEFELFFEYLDGKRNYGEEYLKNLATLYKHKSSSTDFEAIIVCDNLALEFIIEYRELFPDIPIVFCGINNFTKDMIEDQKNIAGIMEKSDHKKNIELILNLHKDVEDILIINDNTNTGLAVTSELNKIIPDYRSQVGIEIYSDFSFENLKGKLKNISPKTAIYLLVLNRDNQGKYISYNDGINLVKEVSKRPIYGAWDFYLGKGIIGGSILSGYLQGVEAGNLLKNIINDKDKNYFGDYKEGESEYVFDYNELKKFNISESSLPRGSKIINSPVNFFDRYHNQIMIFAYLFIVILIVYIINKKKNEEMLITMVEEKTLYLEIANKKLEQLSNIDGLTQLYNRRFFDKNLEDSWTELKRKKLPLSILMIDVDFFKKYNDIYGHIAGDECLKKLSNVFFESVGRPFDTVARYGGEEFTILVNADANGAEKIAKWILEEVKKLEIEHTGSEVGVVTVSIGIGVAIPNGQSNAKELLDLSDNSLYESKNSGRNKYTLKSLEK